jgi:hypothetical protein
LSDLACHYLLAADGIRILDMRYLPSKTQVV